MWSVGLYVLVITSCYNNVRRQVDAFVLLRRQKEHPTIHGLTRPDVFHRYKRQQTSATATTNVLLRAEQLGGDNASTEGMADLTSSLAKLDEQWKIQQARRGDKSRWSKLYLTQDPDDNTVVVEEVDAADDISMYGIKETDRLSDYVWMLEPPSQTATMMTTTTTTTTTQPPSYIIAFTGGAGLGEFPQVAYNELLVRVSDRMNALIITTPYSVGLDHFTRAKETGDRIRRAMMYLQDDPSRPYITSTDMPPTYSLAHSLGCKLQTIYMAATGQDFDGIGFMAFNNFSFTKTMKMARTVTQELFQSSNRSRAKDYDGIFGGSSVAGVGRNSDAFINGLFDFAEMAAGAIGVEFQPSPQDTYRLIQLRYNKELQKKTRLFVFDKDSLDSSKEFASACSGSAAEDGPSLCGLPGGHLTPVFFQWKVDDVSNIGDYDMPQEAQEAVRKAAGDFRGASFGDESSLNALVDAICDWISGGAPGRGPSWANKNGVYDNAAPRLSGQ